MPLYEFRCRDCDDRFEVWLGTGDRHSDVTCPEGHGDTVRIFSPIAMTGRASSAPAPSAPCGASCACHPG
jgi:putative FmdB family regulatory protein